MEQYICLGGFVIGDLILQVFVLLSFFPDLKIHVTLILKLTYYQVHRAYSAETFEYF